jgi:class 3 adenylate cyclase/tetratricopeptide (TPR) repeat protein
VITCPSCGTRNPEGARFCNNCGTALAQAGERRKERKFATALFADLVGSTALAEEEDPEIVQAVVGRTFDRMAEEIARYEGLLEKFMGDAVLAVFGVPRAHEDDAERAVRAALEMHAVLSELNRGFAAEGKPTLEMRIGVEAGEVLVDLERASGPRDRMLTGDAVNTAARLQAAADPGKVLVGAAAYTSTKDLIDYRELDALTLKGKAEPVPAWEALRIKARTRGERPRLGQGLESRLVGRDEELAVLKQTMLRVESEGRPALVTVIGPAGVGKSRLVLELERFAEGLPQVVYWRRGRCLAYGNTSYSALADAVKAQCEIYEDDSVDVATKKADAAARELLGDDSVVPHIRALVGAGEAAAISREDLFEGWRRFLERLAARYPLVLVLDDIHWADDGLLDFVDHVADWAQGPIMVVATARPELFETRPTWGGGKRNAASIYLDPLSPDEGESMLEDLLPGPIDAALKRSIVQRSEGNPLYVEEIVRKLIDDGVLRATEASMWEVARPVEEVELPRSIQGLISARLDGLPDEEKAILQDAAVVGRVFWVGAVADLTGRQVSEVRDALGRLRVKEIVVPHEPSSFSDEHEFAFRHALIRDGAYDSLPKALRADKHVGVARWAERRAGDRAEDIVELVATHETEALGYVHELGERRPDLEKAAFEHAWAAARRTGALWLGAESTRWFREAERLADALEVPLAERAELGREHLKASGGPDPVTETERVARRTVELFTALGDDLGAGWANARLVISLMQQSRHEEAERTGRAAVETLEPLGETVELADALHRLGWFLWRRGREEEAEPLLRRSIEIADRVDAPLVRAEATQTLAVCLLSRPGQGTEAHELMERAFTLAKEVGDSTNLMRAYNNIANTRAVARGLAPAAQVLQEGLELALRSGTVSNAGWIAGTLGDILWLLGRLEESEEKERFALELARQVGDEPLIGQRLASLGVVVAMRGRDAEATDLRDEAAPILRANPEPQADGFIPQLEGYLALARGDRAAAAEHFARAADRVRAYSVDAFPEIFPECVRAFVRLGERDRAEAYRDLDRSGSVVSAAHARDIAGLLGSDPVRAVRTLREAVAGYERLEMRPFEARAMVDLARAMTQAGDDPREVLERGRRTLLECDATLFLFEVDEALAELTA